MSFGIPGTNQREIWMSLWIVFLCMLGSVGHYFYHKYTGKGLDTWTIKSLIGTAVLGFFTGFILVWFTRGGESIGHYDIIPIAIAWGGASESIIGKYLGWKENKKTKKAVSQTDFSKTTNAEDWSWKVTANGNSVMYSFNFTLPKKENSND